MSIQKYIENKLLEFIKEFPNAKVAYKYDSTTCTHSVEVLPQEVYDSSEFCNWLAPFYKELINAYPGEFVAFISEDDYFGLKSPEYELIGSEFYSNFSCDVKEISNIEVNIKTLSYLDGTDVYDTWDMIIPNDETDTSVNYGTANIQTTVCEDQIFIDTQELSEAA
jgi:hypothetical protein